MAEYIVVQNGAICDEYVSETRSRKNAERAVIEALASGFVSKEQPVHVYTVVSQVTFELADAVQLTKVEGR